MKMDVIQLDWEQLLAPYTQAVEELEVKLKGMRAQFEQESRHSASEFIKGRVKPIYSILKKARMKRIPLNELDEMQDIAGVRVVCQFVDDIYAIIKSIRQRQDFKIIEEKDYITNEKESGY